MEEYGCQCGWCQRNPEPDPLTDQWLSEMRKAHPLDPVTEESMDAAVQRLRKRLRAKPGPTLNL